MGLIKKSIIKVVLIACFLVIPLSVNAEPITLDETNLTSGVGDEVSGIYVEENGNIFVVDDNKLLWVIDPSTGAFSRFTLGVSNLADIAITPEGIVWWTDNAISFGYLDLSNNQVKTASINTSSFYPVSPPPLMIGPVTYFNSTTWIANWKGTGYGLFSVSGENICLYKFPADEYPNGLRAADLTVSGNYITGIDWSNDSFFKYNPSTNRILYYGPNQTIGAQANIKTDGNYVWWAEDEDNGRLFRYDDVYGMYSFSLSEGIHPRNIAIQNGDVWFSDIYGGFGRLDTEINSGESEIMNNEPSELLADPTCTTFTYSTKTITPATGTFSWSDLASTLTTPETGLDYYSLPSGSITYGIGIADNKVWVSDRGRQKLIRMQLEVDHNIFLPLLLK